MIRKVVASIAVFAFVWTNTWAIASETARNTPPESFIAERDLASLDRALKILEKMHDHIDRSQFDPEALLEKLYFDSEKIVEYVTGRIRFEQYAGLLRGSRGTLMSRAGNALDQAVLLANLLKDAGYDARILRGVLPRSHAVRLRESLGEKNAGYPSSGESETLESSLRELVETVSDKKEFSMLLEELLTPIPDPKRLEIYGDVRRERDRILEDLEAENLSFETGPVREKLLKEIQDYFWVQFRVGPSASWRDAHPLFPSSPPVVKPTRTYSDEIPGSLQHLFRFSVVIERKVGEKLKEQRIAGPWEVPAANLHGRLFTYANAPNDLQRAAMAIESGSVEPLGFFAPVFDGGLAPGGKFFNPDGVSIPAQAAGSAASGLFEENFKALDKATGAIRSLGGSDRADDIPAVALTAQWMVVAIQSPGGKERTWRRPVIDRLGARARKTGKFGALAGNRDDLLGLIGSGTFMVNCGRIPESYVLERSIEHLRRTLQAMRDVSTGEDVIASIEKLGRALPGTGFLFPGLLFRSFDALEITEGSHTYRNEPSVAALEQWVVPGGTSEPGLRVGVDIINNTRVSFEKQADGVAYDPEASLLFGVWDSFVESSQTATAENTFHAARWLSESRERQTNFETIIGKASKNSPPADIDSDAYHTMKDQLNRGYVLAAPTDPVSRADSGYSWWRIDPVTGSTIACGPDGRGVEITEYQIKLVFGFMMSWTVCTILSLIIFGILDEITGAGIEETYRRGGEIMLHCAIMSVGAGGIFANIATKGAIFRQRVLATGVTKMLRAKYQKKAYSALLVAFSFAAEVIVNAFAPAKDEKEPGRSQ